MAPHLHQLPTMNPALLTTAAGMRARVESLETIGNNLANAGTNGFKADHEFYQLFVGRLARSDPRTADLASMPVAEATVIDFRQGPLEATHSPLDVALNGPGFLAIEGPAGDVWYTRAGSLTTTPEGRLVTPEGFPVRAVERLDAPPEGPNDDPRSIFLPAEGAVEIDRFGAVSVDGIPVGQMEIVEFDDPNVLRKLGSNLFSAGGVEPRPAASVDIRQGHLESSNVSTPEAAVRLIQATRHFETLRRATSLIGDDMDGRAIDSLGRTR